jgi:hypothetical protein
VHVYNYVGHHCWFQSVFAGLLISQKNLFFHRKMRFPNVPHFDRSIIGSVTNRQENDLNV